MSEIEDIKKSVKKLEEDLTKTKEALPKKDAPKVVAESEFNKLWAEAKKADDAEAAAQGAADPVGVKPFETTGLKTEANGLAAAANFLGINWDLFKFEIKPLIDLSDKVGINKLVDLARGKLSTVFPGPVGRLFEDPEEAADLSTVTTRLTQVETKVQAAALATDLETVKTTANGAKENAERAHTEIDKINRRLAGARDAARTAVTGQNASGGGSSDAGRVNESAQAVRNLESQITALLGALD